MVNKGTIACFFTCGYTESGGMQGFLRRINPLYEYRMYLPNKVLRKKQMKAGKPVSMIKEEYSGLTGDALINKILEKLEPICIVYGNTSRSMSGKISIWG